MNKKGFTLIELLVVVAIIGLLSTLAVVALGSARVKARDSKRLSDLKQLQTALELYYTENSSYPSISSGSSATLGSTGYQCLDSTGWHSSGGCATNAYMSVIPTDPQDGSYIYATASSSYTISATLEGSVNGLTGSVTLSPGGVSD